MGVRGVSRAGVEGMAASFRGLALFVFNCKLRFEKLRGKGSQRLAWCVAWQAERGNEGVRVEAGEVGTQWARPPCA